MPGRPGVGADGTQRAAGAGRGYRGHRAGAPCGCWPQTGDRRAAGATGRVLPGDRRLPSRRRPRLALGTDVSVAGKYTPTALPEPDSTVEVDGYAITVSTEPGKGGEITASLTVTRDGRPVDDLEPYLGANGHLVAIRAGDLAYAHVHPVDEHAGPPLDGTVIFDATLDATGRYGLFFDFKHNSIVHTAAFTFDQGTVADMEH